MMPATMPSSTLKSKTGLVLKVLASVVLSAAMTVLGTVGYWLLWPYDPIEIQSLKVTPAQVLVDGEITLEMVYCKHTNDFADTKLFFMNDFASEVTARANEPVRIGCGSLSENISAHVLPGRYKVKMERVYHNNKLNWLAVRATSNEFEVMALPEKATVTPAQLHAATAVNSNKVRALAAELAQTKADLARALQQLNGKKKK